MRLVRSSTVGFKVWDDGRVLFCALLCTVLPWY